MALAYSSWSSTLTEAYERASACPRAPASPLKARSHSRSRQGTHFVSSLRECRRHSLGPIGGGSQRQLPGVPDGRSALCLARPIIPRRSCQASRAIGERVRRAIRALQEDVRSWLAASRHPAGDRERGAGWRPRFSQGTQARSASSRSTAAHRTGARRKRMAKPSRRLARSDLRDSTPPVGLRGANAATSLTGEWRWLADQEGRQRTHRT